MFKIGDTIECTFGTLKGKVFVVVAKLKNDFYSCKLKDNSDNKYYQFDDRTAVIVEN